jgi:hypothetical protein
LQAARGAFYFVAMFLKKRVRHKDGKDHVYYSICESLRLHSGRVVQRQLLHLGELNTTQLDGWQRSIEIIHEDGQRFQRRLFSDAEQRAPVDADVVEVKLSSLRLKQPRRFGECWVGCALWRELKLDEFWQQTLGAKAGAVPWAKVLELLTVNRLLAPRSELSVHEKWFAQTAMDVLLDGDASVASKDRLYPSLRSGLSGSAAAAQGGAGTTSGGALEGFVRGEFRGVALRFDQHLFRGRRRARGASATRLLARSSA